MILNGQRRSNLRRWKEHRRSHYAGYFTTPALFWAILTITCFLIGGTQLPTNHLIAVNQGYQSKGDFFPFSPVLGGSSSGWDSTRQENQGEARNCSEIENFSRKKYAHREVQAEDSHKLHNFVKSSSTLGLSVSQEGIDRSYNPRNGFSKSEKGSSKNTRDLSKADAVEEEESEEKDKISHLWQSINRAEKDQDGDGLEEIARIDDSNGVETSEARNATVEELSVSHDPGQNVSKQCAAVEEMGTAATGDNKKASLRLRRTIRSYFAEHGAERVRQLPPNLFCERSFVLGIALNDGFGNNIYKLLTAAGLGVILNRSLIIGESGAANAAYVGKNNSRLRFPFGDYISYSDQAFSMREVKQLWVDNDCSGKFNRPLVLKIDVFQSPSHSTALCEDWTKWTYPILWFKDAQDTIALQFLLKNQHANVRSAAALVLGDPSKPDSRPNTFGELMMAVVEPKPEVKEAVEWAVGRGWDSKNGSLPEFPDVTLHLRMRQSKSKAAPEAAFSCITRILNDLPSVGRERPRIAVVSDTPSVVAFVENSSLARLANIISFDYREFLSSSSGSVEEVSLRADAFLPPSKRKRDWGPLPRWVAVVDFYIAARAKYAVVSGAVRRVGTTYAQLVASLAAAYTLEEEGEQLQQPARFYSSFQESLLSQGLMSQAGWGHSWRPFGGKLSCPGQPPQCAITPLLPYAWWDAPWQSPSDRDQIKMRKWGIVVESNGNVTDESVERFCRKGKFTSHSVLLALPKARS